MSNFVEHGPCDKCGSSDGVGWYDDGHGTCFVCDAYYNTQGESRKVTDTTPAEAKPITPVTDVFRAIPRRGLTEDAIRKFSIDVCLDKTKDVAHRYPYFKDGQHVANKVRRRETKDFYWEGNPKGAELFGQTKAE